MGQLCVPSFLAELEKGKERQRPSEEHAFMSVHVHKDTHTLHSLTKTPNACVYSKAPTAGQSVLTKMHMYLATLMGEEEVL